jgi:hypothetical protein
MADDTTDVFSDRLEEKVRDLCLARDEWDDIKVCYRGEPAIVPVKLYPYAVVFMTTEAEAVGEEGYNQETGPTRYMRYAGFVRVAYLVPDTSGLAPDSGRKAIIPSYDACKKAIQAAKQALQAWGGPVGMLDEDPVTSEDTRELTSQLRTGAIRNSVTVRPGEDNVSNEGLVEFTIYSRREEYS